MQLTARLFTLILDLMILENRSIKPALIEFLKNKIVLLSGPRQVGKTWLSKTLSPSITYLNFDKTSDRKLITNEEWARNTNLLVFDELHKMRSWKQWIKGVYDTEGLRQNILVTGSARLDTYRKGGDSLAGRHHLVHLFPLSVKEVDSKNAESVVDLFLKYGGFPEPFLKGSDRSANLWRKSHLDVILREDLLDLEKVRDIKSIELLVDLLADRVGSPISLSSLARDLQVSPHTIKHWIQILENLYVIFVVTPYSQNIAKAILKEPKIYFHDTGRVTAGEPARLENLVATHLFKRMHYLSDTEGHSTKLHYLRDKEKREVDFLTILNRKVEWLIEVKTTDDTISPALRYFAERISNQGAFQLVHKLKRERSVKGGPQIAALPKFLSKLET